MHLRLVRLTGLVLVASVAFVLGGCSSDEPAPVANDATTSPETSDTASPTASGTATADTSGDSTDLGDFPSVNGFSYAELPKAAFKTLDATLQSTPQIEGVEAKLVKKGGQEVGLVMRMAIDPAAAEASGFEDGFLPGFAGGVAGSTAQPQYDNINGTRVVMIATPDNAGTAYAWLDGSTATILVFKDAADAQAFAEGAIR